MKSNLKIINAGVTTLLLLAFSRSSVTHAGTLDDVKSLWDPQGITGAAPATSAGVSASAKPVSQARWYRLSNGKQVNLSDWKVVLFMQGHCPYCHKFDPVLKQLSGQYGFSVFSYTIDGLGDEAFPEALPAPPDVMQTFFPNIPVATPTTFLVNVNTLAAYPILQGATDAQGFMARMDTVFQMMEVPGMDKIKMAALAGGFLVGVSLPASADVNGDMNNFFNKLGFASNTSQPQVWQGQAAGYASGGSLYARTQVKTIQLVSMTLPDINAGCGGIDAYLGSFSFINSEQLQRFGKQIMSNAAGYFFDLALQTTVPEIKTAKDFLQKMASDINSMNLSSCQAAQGIVGGLFPRTQVAQQKVCQDIAGESNIFADWAASRQGCSVGGQMDKVQDKASDKDKERVMKNINIMWNALSKNRLFDDNKELKEFVMTLTGTLIFGENSEITPLPARTTDQDLIKAMMEGGTAKIYHCNDSDKCLKVVADATVTIAANKALKNQISTLLSSIQNKAVADEKLTEQEKGFISSTTIPVFKYLVDPQMLGVSNTLLYQLTDYIGYDILLQYIQELIQQARTMVATGNYPQSTMDMILENLNQASVQIAAFQSRVQVQQDALLVVDRQMSYMRQQVSARMMTRYQNNYHFGGSL